MSTRYAPLTLLLTCAALLPAACGNDTANDTRCVPGERQACLCPGGETAFRDCGDSGIWETCGCGEVSGSGGGSGSGGEGGTTGGAGSGGSPAQIEPGCDGAFSGFSSVTPTVLLLVDRSSSMFDETLDGGLTRWEATVESLVGQTGVVTLLGSRVAFGVMAYTHQVANGEAACPDLRTASGGIAVANSTSIESALVEASSNPLDDGSGDTSYKGETPTGPAVTAAAVAVSAVNLPGPKYIVLITDGMPDTCGLADPQCGQDQAVAAVQEAYAAGIETRVVGVGMSTTEDADYLQQLANAGAGLPVALTPLPADCAAYEADLPGGGSLASYGTATQSAIFEHATSTEGLTTAIRGAVEGLRSCVLTLNQSVDPNSADLGSVQLDDQVLQAGSDWTLASATELVLLNGPCASFQSTAQPTLYVSFPCEALAP